MRHHFLYHFQSTISFIGLVNFRKLNRIEFGAGSNVATLSKCRSIHLTMKFNCNFHRRCDQRFVGIIILSLPFCTGAGLLWIPSKISYLLQCIYHHSLDAVVHCGSPSCPSRLPSSHTVGGHVVEHIPR